MSVLDETMGAAFIGVVVAAVLYGVSCVQLLYYYARYPTDAWHLKFLVAAVWLFDTVHQALITHTVYTYLVTNFSNPPILGIIIWSLIIEVLFNGFTALLVQSFYALRIWKLSSQNIWITAIVMLLILGEFSCVLAYAILAIQMHTFAELSQLKGLSMSVNAIAAAGDLVIALSLCFMLHRSRTGFRRSDGLINKLIVFTVNTGLLTSVCAVCSLIAIVVLPGTFIYICFYFTLGRLYTNSILATLNARSILRARTSGDDVLSLSLQDLQDSDLSRSHHTGNTSGGIAIVIDTVKESIHDNASTKGDNTSIMKGEAV
ncbi:hypothetical protein AcW1_004224 [Taiwanofungus camphoratus]|nr:hypothetical protein AcW1_004224 [Antrodia cinnamomea]KAI0959389.1 hypothetical protein AcW1_004224 [Antrodia cinnamomea]